MQNYFLIVYGVLLLSWVLLMLVFVDHRDHLLSVALRERIMSYNPSGKHLGWILAANAAEFLFFMYGLQWLNMALAVIIQAFIWVMAFQFVLPVLRFDQYWEDQQRSYEYAGYEALHSLPQLQE